MQVLTHRTRMIFTATSRLLPHCILAVLAVVGVTGKVTQLEGATVPHNYVTYDFRGAIAGVSTADVGQDDPPFPELFNIGDQFYGSFTVDTLIGPRVQQAQAAYDNLVSLDAHFANSGGEYYSLLVSGGPAPETQIDFHPNDNSVNDRFAVVVRESDGFLTAPDVGDYYLSFFYLRFDNANNTSFPASPGYAFPEAIDGSKFTSSSFGLNFLQRTVAVDPDISGVFVTLELRQPTELVPEPASLALFGAGIIGVCLSGRRRRASRTEASSTVATKT